MGYRRTSDLLQPIGGEAGAGGRMQASPETRMDCLEQLLQAFRDIADRDDIHQAASRLVLVQRWIDAEAERAAADPIFVELRLV